MDRQPLHLLLVEDNDAHAMIVARGFQGSGNPGTMDRVTDGREAIAYVKQPGEYRDRPGQA
jgi:CheY-like chemotaxis protein